jgi:hypothetical protein
MHTLYLQENAERTRGGWRGDVAKVHRRESDCEDSNLMELRQNRL